MPNHTGHRAPNRTWREWTSHRKEQKRQAATRFRSRHPDRIRAARRPTPPDQRNAANERRREQRFRFGDRHSQTIFEAWLSLRSRNMLEMSRPTYKVSIAGTTHIEKWETADQMETRLRKEGLIQ